MAAPQQMPLPFTTPLSRGDRGAQVYILQNLLNRQPGLTPIPHTTEYFGQETENALRHFQATTKLPVTGELDAVTAQRVLDELSEDGYIDNGKPAQEFGYKYKIFIPVYRNRSIETQAHLIHGNGTLLLTFHVRSHGHCEPGICDNAWPSFNSQTPGLNQFSPDGDTPTGLAELDLNGPELNATLFGPYPINRIVYGLQGNLGFLIPAIRDGILVHTGEWSQHTSPAWGPPAPMPNSAGCVHSWPEKIRTIANILQQECGVVARPNSDGHRPYKYQPQGLISIQLMPDPVEAKPNQIVV